MHVNNRQGFKSRGVGTIYKFFLPFLLLYRLIVPYFQSNFYGAQMPGPPNIEKREEKFSNSEPSIV